VDLLTQFFEYEKQEKVRRFHFLNQFTRKGQILLIGSSLMEQFPVYEFLSTHPISISVYNRGIGGITTIEFLELLDTCVFELEPSKIFINIGTNDIKGLDYREEELITRYRLILKRIQARLPCAKLYVLAYYPVNELDDFGNPAAKEWLQTRTNQRIRSANVQIEQLAQQLGCRYLDLNAGLLDERQQLKKEYSVEGVHLYGNGYKVIFGALLPYFLED
jgi:lysophospholipase L1-like esterase